MKLTATSNGVKVFIEGKHIKTIPSKCQGAMKLSCIIDYSKKRLNNQERFLLEYELLKQGLTGREKELAENAIPMGLVYVNVRNSDGYYEIKTSVQGLTFKASKRIAKYIDVEQINRLY